MAKLMDRLSAMFKGTKKNQGDSGGTPIEPASLYDVEEGEGKRGEVMRLAPGQREASVAELKQGYQEVIDLVRAVRGHLEQQSERSERMLGLLTRLPEALESLPETNRNQARLLEAIEGHLEKQDTNGRQLVEAMRDLAQASDQQGQVMSVIQQQLDANHETDEQVRKSFSAFNDTLTKLNESNEAGLTALRRVADHGKETEGQMRELMSRNQKFLTMLSAISWLLAIVALGVALYVAVMVGKIASGVNAEPAGAIGPVEPAAAAPLSPRDAPEETTERTSPEVELAPAAFMEEASPDAEPMDEIDEVEASVEPQETLAPMAAEPALDPESPAPAPDAADEPEAVQEVVAPVEATPATVEPEAQTDQPATEATAPEEAAEAAPATSDEPVVSDESVLPEAAEPASEATEDITPEQDAAPAGVPDKEPAANP